MPKPKKFLHTSFAFVDDDMDLLKYCAEQTGLSQTEVLRRMIRALAEGKKIPGFIQIPTHTSLK